MLLNNKKVDFFLKKHEKLRSKSVKLLEYISEQFRLNFFRRVPNVLQMNEIIWDKVFSTQLDTDQKKDVFSTQLPNFFFLIGKILYGWLNHILK